MKITLVTGGTGIIGTAVACALTGRVPLAVAARHVRPGPDTRHLDYDDPATYAEALADVGTLFLVAPPSDPRSADRAVPFVEAAAEAGVEHIVVNSAPVAGLSDDFPLARVERAVQASGCAWTIVRNHWHMANFTVGLFAPLVAGGELAIPVGNAGVPFVAPVDVGGVAAAVLAEPLSHARAVYEVTGPRILTVTEVAELLTTPTRPVRYEAIDDEDYLARCAERGLPDDVAKYLLRLLTAVRNGWYTHTTGTVERLTGRAPTTFEEFLRTDGQR
ncbi:NmrA family NAD(P)-binding protein [Actinophytocola sp.]|uniref:NmrA family NAD(P)-binding protein n=1 Tax=Actinophytocola sp. TaxID=1872138 RepID=UPI002ED0E0B3